MFEVVLVFALFRPISLLQAVERFCGYDTCFGNHVDELYAEIPEILNS